MSGGSRVAGWWVWENFNHGTARSSLSPRLKQACAKKALANISFPVEISNGKTKTSFRKEFYYRHPLR
jgi:hypothetical protein